MKRRPDETDLEYLTRLSSPVDRLASIDETSDVWVLQRDTGESDEEFAIRCEILECDGDGRRMIARRRLEDR